MSTYARLGELKSLSLGKIEGDEWTVLRNVVTGKKLEGWVSEVYSSKEFSENESAWVEEYIGVKPAAATSTTPSWFSNILPTLTTLLTSVKTGAEKAETAIAVDTAADRAAAAKAAQKASITNMVMITVVAGVLLGGLAFVMRRPKPAPRTTGRKRSRR